jgi:hypothetical protein
MSNKHVRKAPPKGYRWVFTPRFKHWRSHKMIEAKDYGLDSFCFLVRE